MRIYSFNEKFNILETRLDGNLNIEDIVDHYDRIFKDDSLPKKLKVLVDCRNSTFDIDVDEIDLSFVTLKKALNKYDFIQEAIIVNEPFKTVIVTLFRESANFKNYDFRIFSTENAARRWLK